MEKEFIDRMEEQLLAQKKVIIQSLAAQSEEYKKIMEEAAPGVIDGKMLETLGVQDSQRLDQINNALERIKKGTYGICLVCKREIPRERLEAIPYAFMCINCKSRDERRNR